MDGTMVHETLDKGENSIARFLAVFAFLTSQKQGKPMDSDLNFTKLFNCVNFKMKMLQLGSKLWQRSITKNSFKIWLQLKFFDKHVVTINS